MFIFLAVFVLYVPQIYVCVNEAGIKINISIKLPWSKSNYTHTRTRMIEHKLKILQAQKYFLVFS